MKNSPYMKVKKWENQLTRYYSHAEKCFYNSQFCYYNKKRYEKICRNIDKLIDKHH